MKQKTTLFILIFLISILSVIATSTGIFSSDGPGRYSHTSIRGSEVMIYGKGLYEHMSAEVAPQGIAQDYVTLFLSVPALILSFLWTLKGSVRGRYLFAGVLSYFLVTYLFYLVMAMYNKFFLLYVVILGCTFQAFIITMLSFPVKQLFKAFSNKTPVMLLGGFLAFNAICIAFLWLGIIVPPLFNGSIIPVETEHYTTLIVQGLDLSILLPASFVSGILLIRKKNMGYLFAPIYFVFLSLLMTALTAKVIAMYLSGDNVFPVIVIIPVFNLVSLTFTILLFRNIKNTPIETAGLEEFDD